LSKFTYISDIAVPVCINSMPLFTQIRHLFAETLSK